MRYPTIAYMDNGLPVQLLSRRDFLYPDADEKYVPAVLAYIHDTDVGTLNRLLYTQTPEEVVATFPISRTVKNNSPAGPCSTSGRNGWRQEGTGCCRTSWNGWRGRG